jgi:hypothetical protein
VDGNAQGVLDAIEHIDVEHAGTLSCILMPVLYYPFSLSPLVASLLPQRKTGQRRVS